MRDSETAAGRVGVAEWALERTIRVSGILGCRLAAARCGRWRWRLERTEESNWERRSDGEWERRGRLGSQFSNGLLGCLRLRVPGY